MWNKIQGIFITHFYFEISFFTLSQHAPSTRIFASTLWSSTLLLQQHHPPSLSASLYLNSYDQIDLCNIEHRTMFPLSPNLSRPSCVANKTSKLGSYLSQCYSSPFTPDISSNICICIYTRDSLYVEVNP